MMQNILNKPLKLPKFASAKCRSILKMLLTKDPEKRLGSGKFDAQIIKSHPWFEDVDWVNVYERKLSVPKDIKFEKAEGESNQVLSSRLIKGAEEGRYEKKLNYIEGWSFHHEHS
mmetsp:Transcript_22619/g.20088  ORF Transcript_22619/g.20088 Transcript_22619/m.20088 type:complete len:115 (+) Transcript_22619:152-496(+)